jgi:hypothetical protein
MAMSGSGVEIGMMRIITQTAPALIHRDHLVVLVVFFAVVLGVCARMFAALHVAIDFRLLVGIAYMVFVLFWI